MKRPPKIPKNLIEKCAKLNSELQDLGLNISEHDLLFKIYSYLNEFNEFVKTFTRCFRGCGSYCCNIPVTITYIEAQYIGIKKEIKVNKPISIITDLSNIMPKINNKKYFNKCPFLNNHNDCSIYGSRPFVCRTYHIVETPVACKNLTKDSVLYGSPKMELTPNGLLINFSNDILTSLYSKVMVYNHRKYLPFNDIREYFPSLQSQP
jgi:Fe-S-cluster containining protein